MSSWYSLATKFQLDSTEPSFMETLNNQIVNVQDLLDCPYFIDEVKILISSAETITKINHTDPKRSARLQKIKERLSENFEVITEKCLNYALKKLDNYPLENSSTNCQSKRDVSKYPLLSMQLLQTIIIIELHDCESTAKVSNLYRKMLQIYQSNPPEILFSTLYTGYLLRLFSLPFSSQSNARKVIKGLNHQVLGLLNYIRHQQIAEIFNLILDQFSLAKKTGCVYNTKMATQPLMINDLNLQTASISIRNSSPQEFQIESSLKQQIITAILARLHINYNNQQNQSWSCDQLLEIQNILLVLESLCQKYVKIKNGNHLMRLICKDQFYCLVYKLCCLRDQTAVCCQALSILKLLYGFSKKLRKSELAIIIRQYFPASGRANKPRIGHPKVIEILVQGLKVAEMQHSIMQLIKEHEVVQILLAMLKAYSTYNIFHKSVQCLIFTIFFQKITPLMQYLYLQCDIISNTIHQLTNFKTQPQFGILLRLIRYYTTMKIDTLPILQVIQHKLPQWNHFYQKVLKPHVQLQDRLLGKVCYLEGSQQLKQLSEMEQRGINSQYKVNECQLRKDIHSGNAVTQNLSTLSSQFMSVQSRSINQDSLQMLSLPIQILICKEKLHQQSILVEQEIVEQSLRDITSKQNIKKQPLRESFAEYITKHKQNLNNANSNRTSSLSSRNQKHHRMKSSESKKNKWIDDMQQSQIQENSLKDLQQTQTQPTKNLTLQIGRIKILRLNRNHNKTIFCNRQRYVVEATDSKIIKWLKLIR